MRTSRRGAASPWPSRSPVRYLMVGGATFLLDFLTLWFLVDVAGMPAGPAAAVAFLAITAFNFLGQWRLTFGGSGRAHRALARYLTLLLANTVMTAGFVEASERLVGHFSVGKVVISVLIVLWNYPLMDRWVFAGRVRRPRREAPRAVR